jgi:hypothetical protein
MNDIPEQIRAELKRLSPYVGDNIQDTVREAARHYLLDDENAGWEWDCGSGFWQCEMELWNMDSDTCDPEGFVVIRPLAAGGYALIFEFLNWPPENLVFLTMPAAKAYLDTLLAAETPELP